MANLCMEQKRISQKTLERQKILFLIGFLGEVLHIKITHIRFLQNMAFPSNGSGAKRTKKNPAPKGDGLKEIDAIFEQLTPSRQAKLLELARLYLDDQRKNEETQ